MRLVPSSPSSSARGTRFGRRCGTRTACPPARRSSFAGTRRRRGRPGSRDPYEPFVAEEGGVQIFQHEHLSHVSFNIFSKLPVLPLRHMGDLHRTVNQRIVLLVLQSRIQSRYAELDHEHYKRCELDHSDSAREGCTVSTVTVTCEPLHWKYALQVAVEEARRLKKFGLTAGELTRFKSAMMRDSEQLAQQAGFVPSLENLDFVMEHDALGHVVMDQIQGHEALLRLDDVISLDCVNEVARSSSAFSPSTARRPTSATRSAGSPPRSSRASRARRRITTASRWGSTSRNRR